MLSALARGQIVFSDGFESPALGATLNVTGAFTFGPWSGQAPTSGGNAGLVRDPWALAGAQAFVFNGNNPPLGSWIETSFATTPGASYELGFSLGRGGAVGQLLQARVIVFDGAGPASWLDEVAVPAQVSGWTGFRYGFTATGATARLRVVDYSGPNQVSDLWLDGVSVTQVAGAAVPEPGDWGALAGALVLGMAHAKARRRSKSIRAAGSREGAKSNQD